MLHVLLLAAALLQRNSAAQMETKTETTVNVAVAWAKVRHEDPDQRMDLQHQFRPIENAGSHWCCCHTL